MIYGNIHKNWFGEMGMLTANPCMESRHRLPAPIRSGDCHPFLGQFPLIHWTITENNWDCCPFPSQPISQWGLAFPFGWYQIETWGNHLKRSTGCIAKKVNPHWPSMRGIWFWPLVHSANHSKVWLALFPADSGITLTQNYCLKQGVPSRVSKGYRKGISRVSQGYLKNI